jgi:hypothetical protein
VGQVDRLVRAINAHGKYCLDHLHPLPNTRRAWINILKSTGYSEDVNIKLGKRGEIFAIILGVFLRFRSGTKMGLKAVIELGNY